MLIEGFERYVTDIWFFDIVCKLDSLILTGFLASFSG